jgi:hypothetical protein
MGGEGEGIAEHLMVDTWSGRRLNSLCEGQVYGDAGSSMIL